MYERAVRGWRGCRLARHRAERLDPGNETNRWNPRTLSSSPNPLDEGKGGGTVEIRYALLDSRRYPAMYLPYQLFLSSHRRRALPCISSTFPDDFVAEIMRLIRSRRAVRAECCGRARSTVPFPVATKVWHKARFAANARCIFIAVHFLSVRDVTFF